MRTSIVLLCALLLAPALQAQAQAPAKDPAAQLKSLLQERRGTLQKAVEVLTKHYEAGTADLDHLVSAMAKLGDAELELAKNKEERIAVCREQVKLRRDFEKICQLKLAAGTVTELDVVEAKAERLKAEIQLLREQGSPDAAK